jgi:glycosyltransferase involved in cell wall biosynthesis
LVAAIPALQGRVEFRGKAPASEVPFILSSADCLLQSSTREWSSLSVMEALACGATPVVSDIPAFQTLTAQGQEGRLFPVGSPSGLADSLLGGAPAQAEQERMRRRAHFASKLSFQALASRLETVYWEAREAEPQGDSRKPA